MRMGHPMPCCRPSNPVHSIGDTPLPSPPGWHAAHAGLAGLVHGNPLSPAHPSVCRAARDTSHCRESSMSRALSNQAKNKFRIFQNVPTLVTYPGEYSMDVQVGDYGAWFLPDTPRSTARFPHRLLAVASKWLPKRAPGRGYPAPQCHHPAVPSVTILPCEGFPQTRKGKRRLSSDGHDTSLRWPQCHIIPSLARPADRVLVLSPSSSRSASSIARVPSASLRALPFRGTEGLGNLAGES